VVAPANPSVLPPPPDAAAEPVPAAVDADVVPIASLCYSGEGALRRALELRAAIQGPGGTPVQEEVAELFDLIELALE
jgi:hypothetical protein